MTTGKIFTKWDETHSDLWSHQPIRLEHEMHKSAAFSKAIRADNTAW